MQTASIRIPSRKAYRKHHLRSLRFGIVVVAVSLVVGMTGYAYFGGLSWIDAFLNASMILTGMGPVDAMQTTSGKIFAGCYALFSGVAFLSVVAVIAAPIVHQMLLRLHVDFDE